MIRRLRASATRMTVTRKETHMQVKELEAKGLKRKYHVTIDSKQIEQQTLSELKAVGQNMKMPGFRPGNIPMKVLQQRYGKAVQGDVLKQVINRSTNDVITERKLRPALTPQINVEDYKEGGDLTFSMEFEIFPEVPELTLDGITLKRNVVEIDEKEIDDALARIADRSPNLVDAPEGSKAEKGHVATIDFKGMVDGVAFDGGTATDFNLELGSGQFIEGFEDQLVGAKVGDKVNVNVTFPTPYHSEALAGKPALFEVTVKNLRQKETPVIDDAFATARGLENLQALRDAVRTQLGREYDQVVRNQLKKQLFDRLETTELEVPEGMVDLEFNSIWERLQEARQQGDEELAGKSDDELKEEYRAIAVRRVKLGIMLADLGNKNKIQVSREELGRAAMQQASQFPGQERKVLEFYRANPQRMEELRGPILEEKVVDFILSKLSFDDTKVTPEQLMNASEEEGAVEKKAEKPKAKKKK